MINNQATFERWINLFAHPLSCWLVLSKLYVKKHARNTHCIHLVDIPIHRKKSKTLANLTLLSLIDWLIDWLRSSVFRNINTWHRNSAYLRMNGKDNSVISDWGSYFAHIFHSKAAPILYPFIVEYSLICAALIYVMWTNIEIFVGAGRRVGPEQLKKLNAARRTFSVDDSLNTLDQHASGHSHDKRHQYTVDCKGNFLLIFFSF